MERTGELATLPFTYTAGTIGSSGWGGRNWDRAFVYGVWMSGNRVLEVKSGSLERGLDAGHLGQKTRP